MRPGGHDPLVPKPLTSNSKAEGRFDKLDFVYIAEDDEYRCPAGQRAIKCFTTIEHGMTLHKYWSCVPPVPTQGAMHDGDHDASRAGSTKPSSTSCRRASTATPRHEATQANRRHLSAR